MHFRTSHLCNRLDWGIKKTFEKPNLNCKRNWVSDLDEREEVLKKDQRMYFWDEKVSVYDRERETGSQADRKIETDRKRETDRQKDRDKQKRQTDRKRDTKRDLVYVCLSVL